MIVRRAIPETMPLFVPEAADETVAFQIKAIVDFLEPLKKENFCRWWYASHRFIRIVCFNAAHPDSFLSKINTNYKICIYFSFGCCSFIYLWDWKFAHGSIALSRTSGLCGWRLEQPCKDSSGKSLWRAWPVHQAYVPFIHDSRNAVVIKQNCLTSKENGYGFFQQVI